MIILTYTMEFFKVLCKLKYWDICEEKFTTFSTFQLKEDASGLVEVPKINFGQLSAFNYSNPMNYKYNYRFTKTWNFSRFFVN